MSRSNPTTVMVHVHKDSEIVAQCDPVDEGVDVVITGQDGGSITLYLKPDQALRLSQSLAHCVQDMAVTKTEETPTETPDEEPADE